MPAGGAAGGEPGWLPAWAPYVVFGLLTVFLFREFIVSNGLLFGTDVLALGYFARHYYAEMVRGLHIFPLWNPYVYGGLPFVDAMHGDIFYPTTWFKFVMPVHRAMGWKLVLHIFLAGVFTYGWLRHLKVGRPIAAFGGVAYMLAPVMVTLIYPGHDGKLFVSALTPLALWTTDRAIVRGGARRFAVLALVVALLILTAHMQLAYYTTWAIAVLAVFRLVQLRRAGQRAPTLARRFAAFALAGIIGALGVGAVQLWTPLRYLTKYSQRVEKSIEAEAESAYARATSWSLHPEEAFSLVVPEFIGANIQTEEATINTYWGRNPFKLNHEYGGLIPLLLLPLALAYRRRRGEAWLFVGMAGGSLVYALGATTPLFHLFYWLVPGVKLFRAPSSIMFIFAIAVITAAALGLEGRERGDADEADGAASRKVTVYLWSATGVLVLLAVLGSTGTLTDLWVSALYRDIAPAKSAALQANLSNIQRGLWLTALLAGALAGAWHLRRQGRLRQPVWIAIVVLLTVVDLWRVDPAFVRVMDPARIYPRDDTTEFLLGQRRTDEPFRVFSVSQGGAYQPNHFAFYGLEELTGHHGNELGRYMDLVDFRRPGADVLRVLRLLNVRYLVSGAPIAAPGLREAYRGSRSIVYELEGAYPRAMLVGGIEVLPDSLALDRLLSPGFDPASKVLVDETQGVRIDGDGSARGRVSWVERGINAYTLQVETDAPALLLISDNYYPSWRATVDGESTPLLRADYTLRAIRVPPGSHRIVLEYRSALFTAAVWTTLISLLAMIGLVVAPFLRRKSRRGGGEPAKDGAE